ncbi:hypothetical protein NUU61_006032 [Penicillium alfredii]|uniref:Uncharacterized protein n=1 Tax=Penicillium alfredii TaxID=1506179 RepID=A0A9W9F046_9EURO|nr:uncharacterized protein NUU61_006032 [Penicillium alfredii]KAJ5091162.1 hypothetical protein NUU61_006032 [Penicillium alfredii]
MAEHQAPDRSVLGESWVMASTASVTERDTEDKHEPGSPSPQPREGKPRDGAKTTNQGSGSLASSSSSWSMSGPELIMPSIYEVPISEASWVAPHVRSKTHTMRKRRKVSADGGLLREKHRSDTATDKADAGSSVTKTSPAGDSARVSVVTKLATFCRERRALLRTVLNAVLMSAILHLLVLPEVVYQTQDLCHFPVVATLYPDSCVRLDTTSPPRSPFRHSSPTSPEDTLVASQKQLESIFDTTLQTLTPLADILKQSESMLRDLEDQLKAHFPDAKNALDLEFQGSDQAVRTAAWEFDSLRADLRSAVDSLLASPPTLESGGSIARDTRLATQLRRREEYLDRLRAQIRTKADSLGSQFITLDDHLEAVDGIVAREERRADFQFPAADATEDRFQSLLDSLQHYVPFGSLFSQPHSTADSPSSSSPSSASASRPSTLALLRLAATNHRPVADSVLRLTRQLRDVQRVRQGATW